MAKKIGLIAGSGSLPKQIVNYCQNQNIEIFVAAIKNFADINDFTLVSAQSFNIGAVGGIVKFFQKNQIEEIIFSGSIKRPALTSIKPDILGTTLLFKLLKLENSGDNNILSTIIKFLESKKLKVIGAHQLMPELLVEKATLGKIKAPKSILKNIDKDLKKAREIGKLDIGQSIIMQQGIVIGVEAIEGTDELIKRCADIKLTGKKPYLIKICKPNQDKRIDMPTIGIMTVRNCVEAGFAGIIIEAGSSLILDKQEIIKYADDNGLFVVGI